MVDVHDIVRYEFNFEMVSAVLFEEASLILISKTMLSGLSLKTYFA